MDRVRWLMVVLACLAFDLAAARGDDDGKDIVVADFEGDDYGDWKIEGEAFGKKPAQGALPGQMPVTGFQGRGLVNSFNGGDGSTGKLTSPPFEIRRPFINFLVGGGKYPDQTCINLLVDGRTVRTATGPNDQPGGSEQLDWQSWQVKDLVGKQATLQIIDQRTGGWGHINIDQIVQCSKRLQVEPARREVVAEREYLRLPVKRGAAKQRVKLLVDDAMWRDFEIELSDQPDFWVFCNLANARGKKLIIEAGRLASDSKGLDLIEQSDSAVATDELYAERQRPQFHFTSRRGWLNDPNGLVYSKGEYHLFYQHNPYGWDWGNMHWGHAVSKDLVRWQELPIALYPQKFGDWCFSGSAVVDAANTSGFKGGAEDVLVAAYTSTGRGESIVYSNDRGRTWTEYEKNPVVKHAGRDPKLVWHAPSKSWVMAVYDESDNGKLIAFYTSRDLKSWELASRIAGYYECPDLFELAVAGKKELSKWVLYGADGKYVLGQFDGKAFKPETEKLQIWHGNFYAAQTYSDAPADRRIQIGWANGIAFPGMPFNQQMTIPVELTLRTAPAGVRMFAEPLRELDSLSESNRTWKDIALDPGANIEPQTKSELQHVIAEFEAGDAKVLGFEVRGIPVEYDFGSRRLTCRGVMAPLEPVDGRIRLEILVDRGSIEVFGGGGQVAISAGVQPAADQQSVRPIVRGGSARLRSLEVRKLKSAWAK